ncbi:bacteriophage abortive infection AbiH family protein [Bacillus amyloliquefaciens]|uniref:bacteriophage abortive infection AbiH family protein n=1 Tax=Bacillus amyloliquefaciens TaxID=1390 RepID=UPI001C9E11BC|nr:bacteriophage abortive infection AbiH family protein [Bacillus amyloliquefaciens]QZT41188.1 bacteriophage abortive infection AbiH family protein [Bacillus amyloliquefaciens]
MNLFIIGNGFDLAHGLPTQYWDFRTFLRKHYGIFLNDFEEKYYLSDKELKKLLWSSFEFNLANINEDVLFEQMYQNTDLGLESGNVGIADTLRYYFEYEFKYIDKLTTYLKEWIEEVNLELDGLNKRTSFIQESNQDIFLNFNYTTTLEDVYAIPRENVLHIHGVVDSEFDLVLGHSNSDRITYFFEKYRKFQNQYDERSAPIYKILAEYCSKTYKDVHKYMHQLFLLNFDSIEKVLIIGHSLSTVDLLYFKKIKERIREEVEWNIYYYCENDIDILREQIKEIGVNEQKTKFIPCDKFYDLFIAEQHS